MCECGHCALSSHWLEKCCMNAVHLLFTIHPSRPFSSGGVLCWCTSLGVVSERVYERVTRKTAHMKTISKITCALSCVIIMSDNEQITIKVVHFSPALIALPNKTTTCTHTHNGKKNKDATSVFVLIIITSQKSALDFGGRDTCCFSSSLDDCSVPHPPRHRPWMPALGPWLKAHITPYIDG